MAIRKPKPMPVATAPIIDPQTGRLTPEWFQYFKDADRTLREAIDKLNVEFP